MFLLCCTSYCIVGMIIIYNVRSCVTALLRMRDELSAAISNDVLLLIAAVLLRNK